MHVIPDSFRYRIALAIPSQPHQIGRRMEMLYALDFLLDDRACV